MERQYVKSLAKTSDPHYAATKAGYSNVAGAVHHLMANPLIAEATREEARRILREKAGPAAVYVATSILLDEKQPGNTRLKAADMLMKASGMGVDESEAGRDLHEMNGDELRAYAAKLERQADAIKRAQADRARPVIEAEPAGSGVFE
jgi:hypothetical protein